jgi:glycosyltransferase involved in cell wall biosynthesis
MKVLIALTKRPLNLQYKNPSAILVEKYPAYRYFSAIISVCSFYFYNMNIGFDAKRAFLNTSGLGNYSRLLIESMVNFHGEHNYFLYSPKFNNGIFSADKFQSAQIRTPQKFIDKIFHSTWRTYSIAPKLNNDKIEVYHGLSGEIPHNIHSFNTKSVVTIHDLIFLRYPELYKFIDRKIYEKKFRYACKHADKIIAISEQTKTDIINFFGIDESRITVIYQGCQSVFQMEASTEQKLALKQKYNLPEDYLLYVGTVEKRKNLLSVVKALHEEKIDISLVVIGKPTKYSALVSEYIVKNKIKNVLFLEGVQNMELPALYQSARLFIYPSLFEGFGIPIIEALYSGVPVITSKGGCFAEAGGPETCYADTKNPEAIANAIQLLLLDSQKCKKMVEEGLKYAQKFDHQALSNQLNDLYHSLKS